MVSMPSPMQREMVWEPMKAPLLMAKTATSGALDLSQQAVKFGTAIGGQAAEKGLELGKKAVVAEQSIASYAISGGMSLTLQSLDLVANITKDIPVVNDIVSAATTTSKTAIISAETLALNALTNANATAEKVMDDTNNVVQRVLTSVSDQVAILLSRLTGTSNAAYDSLLGSIPVSFELVTGEKDEQTPADVEEQNVPDSKEGNENTEEVLKSAVTDAKKDVTEDKKNEEFLKVHEAEHH